MALAILSGIEADRLAACIRDQDTTSLVKVPGIGKKTAERLVIEMSDRLDKLEGAPAARPGPRPLDGPPDGRADAIASKHGVLPSALDGFMMGAGFTAVLVVLGSLRELIGTGHLFANMHLLFGELARGWTVTVFSDYKGFLLAILPPGAFIFMGFIMAVKNIINKKLEDKAKAKAAEQPRESRRVRTTGTIT